MTSLHSDRAPYSNEPDSSEARPLSLEVYDHLVSELISLRLPPLARLSVDSLARQYGVSQTPVRAALIRLEAEGLVVRKHNSGFSVAPLPTGKQFEEMYLMRELIEPEAARLAAINARLSDVQALRMMYDEMHALGHADPQGNYGKFAVLDGQFHAFIVALSDNQLIKQTLDLLHAHMHLFRLKYHASVAQNAIEEHLAILTAIEDRAPKAAHAAMLKHIQASHQRMEATYQQLQ